VIDHIAVTSAAVHTKKASSYQPRSLETSKDCWTCMLYDFANIVQIASLVNPGKICQVCGVAT